MSKYYPMMVNIENEKCTVVGGGNVANRKIVELIEYGAKVTVVSMEINENIVAMVENEDKNITYIKDSYKREYIKGALIVIAATNNKTINLKIARDCRGEDIFVNVVDNLECSKFIVPAKVKRGDLTITISTNGKCPFYSKLLRKKLELEFDEGYSSIVNMLGDFRAELHSKSVSASKIKEIMASLDMEYYIKRLRKIGEYDALKEMEAYVHEFLK